MGYFRDLLKTPYAVIKLQSPIKLEINSDTWEPLSYDGATLPPGDYEVWLGLLQEGVSWFYDYGDEVIKLDVKVQ